MKLILFIFFPFLLFAQNDNMEIKLEKAFDNAKNGISWALKNIPEKKKSLEKDLIDQNKLIAEVKLSLEIGGVKIKSVGFHETYRVETVLYRSYDDLIKENYIDEIPEIKL